jgi:hypothetical protein
MSEPTLDEALNKVTRKYVKQHSSEAFDYQESRQAEGVVDEVQKRVNAIQYFMDVTHPEWCHADLVKPLLDHLESTVFPWQPDEETVLLQSIVDINSKLDYHFEPLSQEEIQKVKAEREQRVAEQDAKRREELIKELLGARKWDSAIGKTMGVRYADFERTQEEREKSLRRKTTKQLEQDVANLRWRREMESKSDTELRASVNVGQLDAQGHVSGGAQAPHGTTVDTTSHVSHRAIQQSTRESSIVLPVEYTPDRLRHERLHAGCWTPLTMQMKGAYFCSKCQRRIGPDEVVSLVRFLMFDSNGVVRPGLSGAITDRLNSRS